LSTTPSNIILKDVSLKRDNKLVLDHVSLEITARRVGVIGQNGSGKSSFVRLLNGLLPPHVGQVLVHGCDVHKDRKTALNTVGIIFQNPDHQIIFPSVEEEVAFGFEQQGLKREAARKKALDVLKAYDREDWASKQCHALSQGQRHFVCLMSVLAMAPKVIILDEPYAGLDMATSITLHRALEKLEQQIILISHDLDVLSDFDELIWFDKGQVIAQDAPATLIPKYKAEMITRADGDVSA
jgi:biotin transport system ATP-binding protein